MRVVYRRDTNTLRVSFRNDHEGYDSEEIAPGVVVDFAEGGEVVGVEIYDAAASKFDLSKFVLERREEGGIEARFEVDGGFLTREAGGAGSA